MDKLVSADVKNGTDGNCKHISGKLSIVNIGPHSLTYNLSIHTLKTITYSTSTLSCPSKLYNCVFFCLFCLKWLEKGVKEKLETGNLHLNTSFANYFLYK